MHLGWIVGICMGLCIMLAFVGWYTKMVRKIKSSENLKIFVFASCCHFIHCVVGLDGLVSFNRGRHVVGGVGGDGTFLVC